MRAERSAKCRLKRAVCSAVELVEFELCTFDHIASDTNRMFSGPRHTPYTGASQPKALTRIKQIGASIDNFAAAILDDR